MSYQQNEYKKSSIETASPVKLVVLLYEGAIRYIDLATDSMHYSTFDRVNENVQKAKDIVVELRSTLDRDKGGDVAEKLDSLYDYIYRCLSEGNLKKDNEPLLEAKKILTELHSSWQEIAEKNLSLDGGGDSFKGNDSGGLSLVG